MDTGHGATAAFTSLGFTARYREIGELEQQGGALDDSGLDNANGKMTKIPQDLHEPGTMRGIFLFDPTDTPPGLHVTDTLTITYPKLNAGSAAAATLAGTGFLINRKFPALKSNEINMGEFVWQWDGKTGPTFTPEA